MQSRSKTPPSKLTLIGKAFTKVKAALKSKPASVQGLGNTLVNHGTFEKVVLNIIGNDNYIEIGKNAKIRETLFFIRGSNHRIIIEEGCYLGGGELWIEDNNCSLVIHEHTTIEHAHLAITEPFSKLEIGKDCMLANHVEIRTGDSHSIIDRDTGRRINKAANVYLGDHVWIGAHAKILKGVTIGSGAVIGTAAVVTSNIPSNVVAAGVPARVIKTGIDWNRQRILEQPY